jgi:radical SAM protein with 4Fe4S-binding SPASM domain
MRQDSSIAKRNLNLESIWQGQRPLLEHLNIELTERCNNACIHCCINLPADDARAQARELGTEDWQDILRQAVDLGALSVCFTGGEPLLREDFTNLYLYARRLGLQVMLFTNARLVTSELADLWARIPPRKPVEVTAYGLRASSYETVACSPDSFVEFQRGIQLLLERHVPFVIKGALLPPNAAEIGDLDAWAATIPGMDRPPSLTISLDLRNRRDSEARNRQIASLRLTPEEGLAALIRHPQLYHQQMERFSARFLHAPGDRLFICGIGQTPCVDAYGILQPCMGVRAPELTYDLRQGSMRDALTRVFPQLCELRAFNPSYLARCARCFLKSLCNQCPAKSWSENGTLDTPVEHHCQMAHAQARYLGLLANDEQAWEITDGETRRPIIMKEVE